jgi:hypothetical protein
MGGQNVSAGRKKKEKLAVIYDVVWWQLKEIPSVIIGLWPFHLHARKKEKAQIISVYFVIADEDYHLETMLSRTNV